MERGVYETLITQAIEREIQALDSSLVATTAPLEVHEASARISQAIEAAAIRTIESIPEHERSRAGVEIAARIHDVLAKYSNSPAIQNLLIPQPAAMLKAVQERMVDIDSAALTSPLIPLVKVASKIANLCLTYMRNALNCWNAPHPHFRLALWKALP